MYLDQEVIIIFFHFLSDQASPSRSKSMSTLWAAPNKNSEPHCETPPRGQTATELASPASPARPSLLLALPQQRTPRKTPAKTPRKVENTEEKASKVAPLPIIIEPVDEDEGEPEQRRRAFSEPAIPSWDFTLLQLGCLT